MKPGVATALAAPALLVALACNPIAEKSAAEAVAAQMFAVRAAGTAEELLSLYGDHFFQATPRPQWEQLLANLEQRLGPPEAQELVGWNIFVGAQEGATGTFVSLSYAVRYAKAEGSEEITLLREKGAPDFRIVQHQFHSAALLLPEFGGEPPQDAPPVSTSL